MVSSCSAGRLAHAIPLHIDASRICRLAKGSGDAMAKKVRKGRATPSLADDIRASLQEALKYVRGEKADVIVHRVVPSRSDARDARHKLGLSQRRRDGRVRYSS